jgi:hypothetical protein
MAFRWHPENKVLRVKVISIEVCQSICPVVLVLFVLRDMIPISSTRVVGTGQS